MLKWIMGGITTIGAGLAIGGAVAIGVGYNGYAELQAVQDLSVTKLNIFDATCKKIMESKKMPEQSKEKAKMAFVTIAGLLYAKDELSMNSIKKAIETGQTVEIEGLDKSLFASLGSLKSWNQNVEIFNNGINKDFKHTLAKYVRETGDAIHKVSKGFFDGLTKQEEKTMKILANAMERIDIIEANPDTFYTGCALLPIGVLMGGIAGYVTYIVD